MNIPEVVERLPPEADAVPLVFDSPHSGTVYPKDFGHALPKPLLRRAEDAYVDELFGAAPEHGATLVRALFPRSYIDPNRRANDIDETLLAEPWPDGAHPGPKAELGIGLIRKYEIAGPLYQRRLSVSEVRRRISDYYHPYHHALAATLNELYDRFGCVFHVNCHSMRSRGNKISPEGRHRERPDFCVGDRDGSTCAADFTELVVETLSALGYRVTVNKPYKGVELVRRYADPQSDRHSLQIEVNRALYMDEKTLQPNPGFTMMKNHLTRLIETISRFAHAASR